LNPLKPADLRKRASEFLVAADAATPTNRASLIRLAASFEEMAGKLELLTAPSNSSTTQL
jgi:hypothetical protein